MNPYLLFEVRPQGAVSEAGWRERDARACAELRAHHAAFRWRSRAVERYVDELIARWRANPPAPPRPRCPAPRLNDGEDYEDPRTGEACLDGLTHPGL